MSKNEFLTSGQLMEAVRTLDYKDQYKVHNHTLSSR